MEGTISLRSIRATDRKAPMKKNNTVTIQVYMDGKDYDMNFMVPMSMSLMSGQKSLEGLTSLFQASLSKTFGKVERI